MYSFFLMLLEYFETGNLHWFVLFYLFILIRWAVVFAAALRYRPFLSEPADEFVSVVIPVIDEDSVLFRSVLDRIAAQEPEEILVVVNGEDSGGLMECVGQMSEELRLAEAPRTRLRLFSTPVAGKRNAVRIGVGNLDPRSTVTILADSDVYWTENTLQNLLRPFAADPRIGGVTTRQKIWRPERSLAAMVCALLEEIRAEGTMKAMSAGGRVGCLPGRTIAFRTHILQEAMPEFMTERFMGIHKEVSDDRSLTNITLRKGYKTVMQDTSVVYTEPPAGWRRFARHQLRWAEGSQYNNIRMTGWMLRHAPLMLFIYWTDMLMPFLLISVYTNILLCAAARMAGSVIETAIYPQPLWETLVMMILGAVLGFGARNLRAFRNLPLYYLLLVPALTLVLSLFLAPIRILGLMRCADDLPWGTRRTVYGDRADAADAADAAEAAENAYAGDSFRPEGGTETGSG